MKAVSIQSPIWKIVGWLKMRFFLQNLAPVDYYGSFMDEMVCDFLGGIFEKKGVPQGPFLVGPPYPYMKKSKLS